MNTASLRTTKSILRQALELGAGMAAPVKVARGRLRYLSPFPRRFTGAYATYEEAISAARRAPLAGYDHEEIASVAFEAMCRVAPWDYPVLLWLNKLGGDIDGLVDAGGHMGTKYRAFRDLLSLDPAFRWIVYDLPSIARAGRLRAEKDGLSQLHFVDAIGDVPTVPLFLGSGLMQYLDQPLSGLLEQMPELPRHLILNKVALRQGETVVTLERIGKALVPYQIRNERAFLQDINRLGYRLIDRWAIPSLGQEIDTHPELGRAESTGFYLRLES